MYIKQEIVLGNYENTEQSPKAPYIHKNMDKTVYQSSLYPQRILTKHSPKAPYINKIKY